jgi:restriction system protein
MDFGLGKFFLNFLKTYWLYVILFHVVLILVLVTPTLLLELFKRSRINNSRKKGAIWRADQDLLSSLRGMDPTQFEEYIADLFIKLGYLAKAIGHTGDHGIDVEIEKDGVTSYIQCKRYSISNKVGEPEVRNFLGSLDHMHAQGKGYFVTTNVFTLQAEKFAEDKPIELVDGRKLIKFIQLSDKK